MGAELAHSVVPDALALVVGTFAEPEGNHRKAAAREVAFVELRGPDAALLEKLRARATRFALLSARAALRALLTVSWCSPHAPLRFLPLPPQAIVEPVQPGGFLPGLTSVAFACDDLVRALAVPPSLE